MRKSRVIGILILAAYIAAFSFLTTNPILVSSVDLLTGILVIFMAALVYQVFRSKNKTLTNIYTIIKTIDGSSLIIAGFFVLITGNVSNPNRQFIWKYNVLLFSFGYTLLSYLLYRTKAVPIYISIWGMVGSTLMFIGNLASLSIGTFGVSEAVYQLPLISNEILLAFRLIFKGFNKERVL